MVNTKQIFKQSILEVKRLGTENMKESVEELENKESSGENESTTVMVSGLPEGSTKNSVHIHFQKKKNGGGEVNKVEMLGEGKAMITFQDPQGGFHCNLLTTYLHTDIKFIFHMFGVFSGDVSRSNTASLQRKHVGRETTRDKIETQQ